MKQLSIIEQVRMTGLKKNRLPLALGLPLGGLVPFAVFMVAHHEVDFTKPLLSQPMIALVLGGLVYSASTVYKWMSVAVGSPLKALGFTVLVEGIMTFSSIAWLSYIALAYLVFMNAVATACTLTCDRDETRAKTRQAGVKKAQKTRKAKTRARGKAHSHTRIKAA